MAKELRAYFGHPHMRIAYSFYGKQPKLVMTVLKGLVESGIDIISMTDLTPLKEHIRPHHKGLFFYKVEFTDKKLW